MVSCIHMLVSQILNLLAQELLHFLWLALTLSFRQVSCMHCARFLSLAQKLQHQIACSQSNLSLQCRVIDLLAIKYGFDALL